VVRDQSAVNQLNVAQRASLVARQVLFDDLRGNPEMPCQLQSRATLGNAGDGCPLWGAFDKMELFSSRVFTVIEGQWQLSLGLLLWMSSVGGIRQDGTL
jgi:hypothetical protein